MSTIFEDPGLAQIYDAACTPREDFAYCERLAAEAGSVLDLGCGTGEFLALLGKEATGVDPAAAMLANAAGRPGGDGVTWVEGDARSVRLGRSFDLIVLTGHAYQCFLTDEDQSAVLGTIAAHLAPGGRFIFDTRNPDYPATKGRKIDESLRTFTHPEFGEVEAWNESRYDAGTGILSYANHYRIVATGERRGGPAQIRYTPKARLEELIAAAGLVVDHWLGDWSGTAFHSEAKEIIPLGSLK